ncbi:MAG: ATP-dependent DNA helicase RecG [Alphaproteobacteria bacterium]|nr:ATP-dependent DNA helicase RecG [Alphaproteobacteria bacterium]
MRPPILFPLFAPLSSLPGVGPKIAQLLNRLIGAEVVDLLWHLPVGAVRRIWRDSLNGAVAGEVVAVTVTIEGHLPGASPRRPTRVRAMVGSTPLSLVYFNARGAWLEASLPVGGTRIVGGKLEQFQGEWQITHPDLVLTPDRAAEAQRPEVIYPLTAGLTSRLLARTVQAALAITPELPEWQDSTLLAREGWRGWRQALIAVHGPEGERDLSPHTPDRRRLAYDELLANQLALGLVREHNRRQAGRAIIGDGRLIERLASALPFALTGAQIRAIADIRADLSQPRRMLRLLQGDVGSGKTVVALHALLIAIEAGCQGALMAPTEILARQHAATLTRLLGDLPVRVVVLTGRDKGKAREALLAEIASGHANIIVGTHALIQESVSFQDLAVAVVDEQHRFGVAQRLALAQKGRGVDVLVMTATPIPRTLLMTSYGDLDASRLDEKPPGRTPIATRTVAADRLDEVVAGVARAVAGGAKVYWVCPLVEETDELDLAAAVERHSALSEALGAQGIRVALIHGRMKPTEKDAAMAAFQGSDADVLVATTVIEVGVDVPDASVMVIEHAERFGLAQLHQLRGRVGRGQAASSCLLVYSAPLSETARARLQTLRDSDDGFAIAEADLALRGAGEVLGTRQSGLPGFRVADPAAHGDLIAIARDEAALILNRDPDLTSPRAAALRVLLYLFERDAAARLLRAG